MRHLWVIECSWDQGEWRTEYMAKVFPTKRLALIHKRSYWDKRTANGVYRNRVVKYIPEVKK